MKKRTFMELGRSMVEMLGVLAVIGVLTIVGLAGYRRSINKIHANELMDLAVKVYNEAVARDTLKPSATTNAARLYLRSSAIAASANQNLGWDRPIWTNENFNIMARPCDPDHTQNSHVLIFYNLTEETGGKDVCAELASMTEPSDQAHYRLLPGSKRENLPNGVLVACNKGASTNDTNSWW